MSVYVDDMRAGRNIVTAFNRFNRAIIWRITKESDDA